MNINKLIGYSIGVIMIFGVSWLVTCGFVKFVTWCFGIPYSWRMATGIWAILNFTAEALLRIKKK